MGVFKAIVNWKRRASLDGSISLQAIPFELEAMIEKKTIRWFENAIDTRSEGLLLGGVVAVIGLVSAFGICGGVLTSDDVPGGSVGFGIAFLAGPFLVLVGAFFFLHAHVLRNVERMLEIDFESRVARILIGNIVNRKVYFRAECEIEKLELVRSPARLQWGQASFWEGTVLYAKIGEEQIVLACKRGLYQVGQYEKKLPKQIREMVVSSDVVIEKSASRAAKDLLSL